MEEIISFVTAFVGQVMDGFGRMWIFGFLPALFLLYLLAAVVSVRVSSGAGLAREIRSFRKRSAFSLLRESTRRFFKLAGILTLLVVILPPFLYFNIRHTAVLDQLAANMGTLISMVIGLTTIVLTVSVVIILFHKNYYLVFSISDVLKSYHFAAYLAMLLAGCLGTCASALLGMYLSAGTYAYRLTLFIMECCIITSLAAAALSFRVIYLVMLSNSKVELHLLDGLYKIYRGEDEPDETSSGGAKDWELGAVRTNVEYLCGEYTTSARILPVHRVVSFGYLHGDARQACWEELYSRLLTAFIYTALGIWLASMIVVSIVMGRSGSGIMLMNTLLMAAVTGLAYLGYRAHGDQMQLLFDDTFGYEMVIRGKKDKKVRIPRIRFTPANRYDRFVQCMNSLTAFFRIGIDRGMTPEMTREAICIMIDWLSDVKERHRCLYLPVFAAGYYAYCGGMEIGEVRDCFVELCGEDAGRDELEEMIRGHLEDITRDQDAGKHAAAAKPLKPAEGPAAIAADIMKSAAETKKPAADTKKPAGDPVLPAQDAAQGLKDAGPATGTAALIADYIAWLELQLGQTGADK